MECFLIENREEYLSFSTNKNYTTEQRDYNNRLTARLLEHATKSKEYPDLFENCVFASVRDRIRSYYKSYVQSFKRRRERQMRGEQQHPPRGHGHKRKQQKQEQLSIRPY